jgi:hypothetical protein
MRQEQGTESIETIDYAYHVISLCCGLSKKCQQFRFLLGCGRFRGTYMDVMAGGQVSQ